MAKLSEKLERIIFFLCGLIILTTVGLSALPKAQHIADLHPEPIKYYKYVGMVVGADSKESIFGISGTAFAVDSDHLITAGHVCTEGLKLIEAKEIQEKLLLVKVDDFGLPLNPIPVDIKAIDKISDLCLLYSKNHKLLSLDLAPNISFVNAEDPIVIPGAPRSIFPVIRRGEIVSIEAYRVSSQENKIFISALIQGGMSGAPVIWYDRVIGVTIISIRERTYLGVATSVVELHDFLYKYLY